MNEPTSSGARIELSPATLGRLDPRIAIPRYDRGRLGRGIVHIGVGGFHRAHQAVYLDDLCARGETGWSITGAGVLPADAAMADALGAQSGLYTLVTRDASGVDVRVIGTITDYLHASPSADALVARIADPATRIVSMTVTEGGYPHDEATMTWTPSPDGVLPPAFAAIARGLAARRASGIGGLTVQSCDNVMHNGKVA
jgi:mannitol 2-dehydrogenase